MRTLTADTIIRVRTPLKTPAKKPLTGDTRNSWRIHKNGFTAVIKREKGKYLFTGFYDHRTEKQAADTIKAVNAKYGYTPSFLDMYDQVGAALTSMGKINSQLK